MPSHFLILSLEVSQFLWSGLRSQDVGLKAQDVDLFCLLGSPEQQSLEMGKNLLQLFLSSVQFQAAAEAYPGTSGWPVYTAIICAIISVFKGLLVSSVPLIWAQLSPRKSPCSPSCSFLSRWGIWELLSLQPPGKPTCHLLGTGDAPSMSCQRLFSHRILQASKPSKCKLFERFSVIMFWAFRHSHIMCE